jgi:hypothetical protein
MNNENGNMAEQSVTAIAKSAGKLKAVELRKRGDVIDVIKTRSSEENAVNWQDFAIKCGLSIEPLAEGQVLEQNPSVVGYDSAGTAFSRVNIPAVEEKEIESMVQLQAESRLPLPADQMELAWRADKAKDGQLAITIAAARRQQVQHFINKIISFRPVNIFLDCEGIVKIWKEIFSGSEENAVIINADARNTQICLVRKGKLINAVALDIGIDDFAEAEADEHTENIERFVQDTRSVVDLFGIEKSERLPVYVLSDGSVTYSDLVSSLKEAGLSASLAKPETGRFSAKSKLSAKEIFEYRLQIGLALMVIDASGSELNLFKRLYKPFGDEEKTHWLYSPKIAGAIAIVTLILFLGVSYAIDAAKPRAVNKAVKTHGLELEKLVDEQEVLTAVQMRRPDLLQLLNSLTMKEDDSTNRGRRGGSRALSTIQLESFDYKRGKKITVTGTAADNVALYDFETQLTKNPKINDVVWTPTQNRSLTRSTAATPTRTLPTRTAGNSTRSGTTSRNSSAMNRFGPGSVRFSMEFHYGNFTRSATR